MPKKISLTGQKFSRLFVVKEVDPVFYVRHRKSCYECLCDCGNTVLVVAMSLRAGVTKSCGCLNAQLKTQRTIHGFARNGRITKIYTLWTKMKARCSRPNNLAYRHYGGRGIYVCERWQKFPNFFADMGYRPRGKTLGRIDNDGPYSPENCRWETPTQQARNTRMNKRYTILGITGCVAELADHFGISQITVRGRFRYGWTPHEAFTIPPRAGRKPPHHQGYTQTSLQLP